MARSIGRIAGLIPVVVVCLAMAQAQPAADAEAQKRIDGKTSKLLEAVQIDDAARADRVKRVLSDWYATLGSWHRDHDAELSQLWSAWSKARSVVPKDEYPGEVIAYQIDDVYASLKPEYQAFLERLSTELDADQIEAIQERWSRSPGMTRTYNAYLEIAPDLTDEQRQVILDRMKLAREAAMLTDSDKEIVNIYKRHKVKVEQYIGSLEWTKLHRAFAARGRAPSTAPARRPSAQPTQ